MSVPFVDLRRDVQAHREAYLAAAARVLDSGVFTLGPEVQAFEQAFGNWLGIEHVIGVNGGTLALYAACLALGIGAGDDVIVPANTFVATVEALMMAGARPVFCDVDPQTGLIDLSHAEQQCTAQTKAIVPVHLYGQAVDMPAVMTWARQHDLRVIEDAAQAHGAKFADRSAGTFADIGCFSFYPSKNLGAFGEGGASVTHDPALAEQMRAIRCHGIKQEKYRHDVFGSNLKMDAIQAAFLSLKLQRLQADNVRRRQIADRYRQGLKGLPIDLPIDVGDRHVYHLFVIQTERREALRLQLEQTGIGTGIHYPTPIYLQPGYAHLGVSFGTCPQAEHRSRRILSLPMFAQLTDEEVDMTIAAVRRFFV